MKVKESNEGCWFKGRFIPNGGGVYLGTTAEFFRGPLEGISRALKAEVNDAGVCVEQLTNNNEMAKIYRIRKLTPRECFRLMNVSDHDIDNIQNYPHIKDESGEWVLPDGMDEKEAKKLRISESQQYRMAGNSIVVSVLKAIFTQMFRKDQDVLF